MILLFFFVSERMERRRLRQRRRARRPHSLPQAETTRPTPMRLAAVAVAGVGSKRLFGRGSYTPAMVNRSPRRNPKTASATAKKTKTKTSETAKRVKRAELRTTWAARRVAGARGARGVSGRTRRRGRARVVEGGSSCVGGLRRAPRC